MCGGELWRILLASTLISIGSCIVCPAGYLEWFDSRCFRISLDRRTFDGAVEGCKSDGGNLISIHSAEETVTFQENAKFTLQLSRQEDCFIGLRYDGNTMDYTWVDGSAFDYTPRVVPHACDVAVGFYFDHISSDWNSATLDKRMIYVCEYQPYTDACLYYTPINGRCMKYYSTMKAPNDAEDQCVQERGHMVSIHTDEDNTAILEYVKSQGALTGVAIGLKTFGTLRYWNDHTTGTYYNFQDGYPMDNFGDCDQMNIGGAAEGQWSNVQCGAATVGFICARSQQ